jgi:hypothetical protein
VKDSIFLFKNSIPSSLPKARKHQSLTAAPMSIFQNVLLLGDAAPILVF